MQKKKPKWNKPKLVILVRDGPQVTVLDACKTGAYGDIGGYNSQAGGCVWFDDVEVACTGCDSSDGS